MPLIDSLIKLPSVDRLVNDPQIACLVQDHGAPLVTDCARQVIASARRQLQAGETFESSNLVDDLRTSVDQLAGPSLRRVINLTGTVLHTNLGRAALPESAIEAMAEVARGASNLEFDLVTGKRGDRQLHLETLLCKLTGADRALVVNNNAAAVLLTLNSLALRRQVPVSRGELVEIGGAFRMPDIMKRAGCKLVEVGTTNRTHARDFEAVTGSSTAMLMKVHTSNYQIKGFTSGVSESKLAEIAHRQNIPLLVDLGSGTLVDLENHGLPREPTVSKTLNSGADLVTFSGDKLLGGPQAGIIVGREDLVEKIRRNPMTRALRPDKLTLAALQAVLRLYTDPARLAQQLPSLRLLTRALCDIEQLATRLAPVVQEACPGFQVSVEHSHSQVGSGSLPVDMLESAALKFSLAGQRRPGKALDALARAFRELPIPVIGRISEDALWLDLRCLEDEAEFIENLAVLSVA